jgi:alpha-1,2-mannosyltransferase
MAAVALFLLAVAGYALLVHATPQYYWRQIDTAVYRDGGIVVRNQPATLYALRLGPAKLPFIYTPFAALVMAAGSSASFATWQVGLAVLTIGLLPVVTYLSLGLAGRPAGLARAAAAFAIAAVGLWLEPVAMTLFFGQINLVLLALVVGDLALPDRIKGKGIGIGLAAGIKLTPLIFIPYLLFTRRAKAAAVSALAFAVTVGLGFALLPHASAFYWGGQFTKLGGRQFHLDNQSLNGVILRLTHIGPDAHAYWLVAAVVVGIAGLATSILASRRGHELLGFVACAATGLLVSPISWSHHYVYVLPALVLAAYGPRRLGYRILGAALVVGLFGWWPLPIGSQGGYDPRAQLLPRGLLLLAPNQGNNGTIEFTWRGLELILGNYYVLTLLVLIAATACALVLTSRLRPERPGSLMGRRRSEASGPLLGVAECGVARVSPPGLVGVDQPGVAGITVDVVGNEPAVVGQRLAARRQVVERELRESAGDALPAELGIHHRVPDHDAAVPRLVNDRSDDLVPDRRVVAAGIGAVADDYAAVHVPLSSPVTLPDPA